MGVPIYIRPSLNVVVVPINVCLIKRNGIEADMKLRFEHRFIVETINSSNKPNYFCHVLMTLEEEKVCGKNRGKLRWRYIG